MTDTGAEFRCIDCGESISLLEATYQCRACGGLLEVYQCAPKGARSASEWAELFDARQGNRPGIDGSGVWRFREWVQPDIPDEDVVTLGEGNTPLVRAGLLSERWGAEILVKQCGQSLSGSFKDLGMTVLVSQVNHMRKRGIEVPAVACASTGDTSAALAAYGAAAGLRTLVLLPKGKISGAQLVQPLAHGARVIAIDTDFDGCMAHVSRLCDEAGVYLANSKNSLRIEGQKTVALEIVQGLDWELPDWVAIPGGNLGNVSALTKGFELLRQVGLGTRLPRILCAQAENANPLYRSFIEGFSPLEPVVAKPTHASAIRIGNPVSFPKAVRALKACDGAVVSIDEETIAEIGQEADHAGLYVCPHTAVALAGVKEQIQNGLIEKGAQVVVVATAHGLKFTEFKTQTSPRNPVEVGDDYAAVKDAALG